MKKICLTLVLFSVLASTAPSKASESGVNWKKNYKMGSSKVEDGTEMVNAGPPIGYIWIKKYKNIPCCVPATDSDACDTSSQKC